MNNLAIQLTRLYTRERRIENLKEAYKASWEALGSTPKDHPHSAGNLETFGNVLMWRYRAIGIRNLNDLNEAIRISKLTLDLTPRDHPKRARMLNNLGYRLEERYSVSHSVDDLEEAIQAMRQAIQAVPEGRLERLQFSINLAYMLQSLGKETCESCHVQEAQSYFVSSLMNESQDLLGRIVHGKEVVHYHAGLQQWGQAFEAAQIAVHLVPQLSLPHLESRDKYYSLTQIVGLSSDAAAIALQANEDPFEALCLLEHGRDVVAASFDEPRADMADLQRQDPSLAKDFVSLRDELQIATGDNIQNQDKRDNPSPQFSDIRRHELGQKLKSVLADIRQRADFADFMSVPNRSATMAAARDDTIAAINVSKYRCDAIIVQKHAIRAVALPDLHLDDIKQKSQDLGIRSRRVLEWLWDTVAGPILTALGFEGPPSNMKWPRIWWILTGPLSQFPIHAAGRHFDQVHETVLDRARSSYISSVKVLIHGRRRKMNSTSNQAVLVAMEHTPRSNRLIFAPREVSAVRELCASMNCDPIEPSRHKKDILSHLPFCRIFHFAGHGHTNSLDPSQSQLLLEDGSEDALTIEDVLSLNLREHTPFLAYLSACGTGKLRDERFIDESFHLISAFHVAGFRHVIGTLWEVNDQLCVDMSRMSYEGIIEDSCTDEAVCAGINKASKELRDRWVANNIGSRAYKRSVRRRAKLSSTRFLTNRNNVQESDPEAEELIRTLQICSDDEDDDFDDQEVEGSWIPFIHWGV